MLKGVQQQSDKNFYLGVGEGKDLHINVLEGFDQSDRLETQLLIMIVNMKQLLNLNKWNRKKTRCWFNF